MKGKRRRPAAGEWRARLVLRLYASGEPISKIALQAGWSEGRVRKVLREAGVIVTDKDRDGSREE